MGLVQVSSQNIDQYIHRQVLGQWTIPNYFLLNWEQWALEVGRWATLKSTRGDVQVTQVVMCHHLSIGFQHWNCPVIYKSCLCPFDGVREPATAIVAWVPRSRLTNRHLAVRIVTVGDDKKLVERALDVSLGRWEGCRSFGTKGFPISLQIRAKARFSRICEGWNSDDQTE